MISMSFSALFVLCFLKHCVCFSLPFPPRVKIKPTTPSIDSSYTLKK